MERRLLNLTGMPSSRPTPVAIFLTSFDIGGTERQMAELIRRLDPRRFAVHVACFHRRGPWLAHIVGRAASITEFPIRGFGRPATVREVLAFARWCRERGVALVHTCDLYANIFGLAGAALAGVPVRIGSRRNIESDPRRSRRTLQSAAYRLAHAVVANSNAAARRLVHEGIDSARLVTIPNGIDLADFTVVSRNGNSRHRLITVANLRPEKGIDVLIDAVAILAGHGHHLHLSVAGEGPLRLPLEQRARVRGVGPLVSLLGARHDVPELLRSADLFVFPSRTEASPNAVLEAMASGLPIVATEVGGIPELLDDGRTGRLVPPGDPGALARAIDQVMHQPDYARQLGSAARHEVESRFSFDRMVRQFEALYESLILNPQLLIPSPQPLIPSP